MKGVSVQVELSGPFFKHDPAETILQNVGHMMEGLAEEGERSARAALASGDGSRAPISRIGGHISDHIVGRVISFDPAGKRWRAAAVVSVPNPRWNHSNYDAKESKALMAAASVIEGRTRVFRNLARSIRSSRAVLRANLTAGIE